MTKINEILQANQEAYTAYTEKLKADYLSTRDTLETKTIEELLENRKNDFHSSVNFLFQISISFCLFPDPLLDEKLKALGFSTRAIRWFIDLNWIDKQFNEIQAKDFIILKFFAIMCIHHFIDSKVKSELLLNIKKIVRNENTYSGDTTKMMNNLKRRLNYNSNRKVKSVFDQGILEQIKRLQESASIDKKEADRFIFDGLKGDIEKLYAPEILKCFIPRNKISKPKIAEVVYELMNKLLRGKYKLMTEKQFYDSDASYDNRFFRYVAKKLDKIGSIK